MFFRSNVDSWFYALVVSLPIVLFTAVLPKLANAHSTVIVLAVTSLILVTTLPAWLLISTFYRVDSTLLRVQAGPFNWVVPLEKIHAVTATRSFGASPALSLNRLKIEYGRGQSISVSPRHRVAFIEAIGQAPANILRKAADLNTFTLEEDHSSSIS